MKIPHIVLTIFIITLCLNLKGQTPAPYSFGVKITGHGKPMVLVPGLKGAAETFDDVVAHYKDHYTCYVITLAGFAGQPPSGAKENLLRYQADDIARYIKDKHLKKPVLVGFSFGGTLALWIATLHPAMFGPVIDIDGVPFESALEDPHVNMDSLYKANAASFAHLRSRTPAQIARRDSLWRTPASHKEGFKYLYKLESDSARREEILRWDEASDNQSAALMELEMDTLDLRKSIAVIKSPILVIGSWQGWDVLKTKEQAELAYKKQFVNAYKVTVVFSAEGKHFLMYDDLQWLLGQMDAFLLRK